MEIIVVSGPNPADTPLGVALVTSADPGPEPDAAALAREDSDRLAESAATNARIYSLEEALATATSRAESLRTGRHRWLATILSLMVVGAILQVLLSDRFARGSVTSNPADFRPSAPPKPPPVVPADSPLRRFARLPFPHRSGTLGCPASLRRAGVCCRTAEHGPCRASGTILAADSQPRPRNPWPFGLSVCVDRWSDCLYSARSARGHWLAAHRFGRLRRSCRPGAAVNIVASLKLSAPRS